MKLWWVYLPPQLRKQIFFSSNALCAIATRIALLFNNQLNPVFRLNGLWPAIVEFHKSGSYHCYFFSFMGWSGAKSTITKDITGLLYQPRMVMDDDECGAVSGMLGWGNWNCPSQIPHDLTRAQTRATAVGIWWLTAWATALPATTHCLLCYSCRKCFVYEELMRVPDVNPYLQ
jgi:hypothetical protein